jgi:hypothetical protein
MNVGRFDEAVAEVGDTVAATAADDTDTNESSTDEKGADGAKISSWVMPHNFNNDSKTSALDGRLMACGAHIAFNKSANDPAGNSGKIRSHTISPLRF